MTPRAATRSGEDKRPGPVGLPASAGAVPASEAKEAANRPETAEKPAQVHLRIILDAFIHSVERLEQVLDDETRLLQQHKPVALHDFNHKKSHGLLEFSRAMSALRTLDPAAAEFAAKASLIRLRTKLAENLAMLQTHLGAVSAIAATIARVIQDHDSDGTYTRMLTSDGRQR